MAINLEIFAQAVIVLAENPNVLTRIFETEL